MTTPAPAVAWTAPTLEMEMTYLTPSSGTMGGAVNWGKVLQPIKLTRTRGPQGGELTCRAIRRWAWSGAGYVDPYMGGDPIELLRGGLLSLFVNYGYGRQMIFRGMLQAVERQFGAQENGVTLVFSDWLPANLYYVSGIQYSLNVGATISNMNEAPIWLTNASGAKLYQAGPSATGLDAVTPDTFTYQPVGTSVCRCIESNKRYLADIQYPATASGTAYIVARKRGASSRTLWHGKVGAVSYASQYAPTVTELRGSSDYSRIIHQITGIGGSKIEAKSVSLTPAWNTSLNAQVLANPALLSLPEYSTVGRIYTMSQNAFGLDATMGQAGNEMSFKLWGAHQGGQYSELPQTASLVNSSASANPAQGYKNFATASASQFVELDGPAIYEYYDGGRRRYQFYALELQANFDAGLLTMTSTASNPSPLAARRIWQNDAYTSMTVSGTYARPTGTRAGRAAITGSGYDTSLAMAAALRDVLATTEGPMQSITAKLVYTDFTWMLGTAIDKIRDAAGVTSENAVNWYVESITHNLRTEDNSAFTTEIEISRDQSEYLGGLVL